VFTMRKYDKEFKEEAVKLSDEVGVKQAAAQLGVPYYFFPLSKAVHAVWICRNCW